MAQLDALLECPFVPRGTIVKLEGLSGATFDVASAVRGVVTAANAACGLRLTEPTPLFKVSGDARGEKRVSHAAGQQKRAKFPTSKAPISAIFHSFRLIFGRAIISRNGLDAWMLFSERARAEHPR